MLKGITLTLEIEQIEAIRALAAKDNRSVSFIVRELLKEVIRA